MATINPIINLKKRLSSYLNADVGVDVDNKVKKLKYTVIRLYFGNLVKTLKNADHTLSQDDEIMYLKKIVHSKIINEISYEFPERIIIILNFLNDLCNRDSDLRDKIAEWDKMTIYF